MTADGVVIPAALASSRALRSGGPGPAALYLVTRLLLPPLAIGRVDWSEVLEAVGWDREELVRALLTLEKGGLMYVDGPVAWAPGVVEADDRLQLHHWLKRKAAERELGALPDGLLVRGFRRAYRLDGTEGPFLDAREALTELAPGSPARVGPFGRPRGAARRDPAPKLGPSLESPTLERGDKEGADNDLAGQPPTSGLMESPKLGPSLESPSLESAAKRGNGRALARQPMLEGLADDAPPRAQTAEVKPLGSVAVGSPPRNSLVSGRSSLRQASKEVPPPLPQPTASGYVPIPYDQMWTVVRAAKMVKPAHKLTDLRKAKLKALWEEWLKRRADPYELLRRICEAVQADPWWGPRQDTWLPETCWRNAERREKFTLIAEGLLEQRRSDDPDDAPASDRGGAGGARRGKAPGARPDRYAHLVSRGGGDAADRDT